MQEPVEPDDLRIGLKERDAAAELLGDHFAAGRLTPDEHEQRVGAALAAQTWGDLRDLFHDLPPASGQTLEVGARATAPWRLPPDLYEQLVAEGVLLLDQALRGSITYRRFRTAHGYSNWRRVPVTGTVVVTGQRLLVWAANAKQVDLPIGHPLRAAVTFSVRRSDRLHIEADAARFGTAVSGRIEYRFRTRHAARIRDLAG